MWWPPGFSISLPETLTEPPPPARPPIPVGFTLGLNDLLICNKCSAIMGPAYTANHTCPTRAPLFPKSTPENDPILRAMHEKIRAFEARHPRFITHEWPTPKEGEAA